MKRSTILPALALASLPLSAATLSGCATDGYGYGVGTGWRSYPYNVWYDGYYGSLYDGYWGTDGYFWFRLTDRDRSYRRGVTPHFRKDGDQYLRDRHEPDPRYRSYHGESREPQRGTRMPNYPRDDRRGH